MKQLNLPQYSFSFRKHGSTTMILDTIRKKYVKLTPEEWVRQNFIRYLVNEGKYPPGLIGIEVFSPWNRIRKRVDILIHNRKGKPVMIVECKSHEVEIDENKIFDQVTVYNWKYQVPYIVVTNGMFHYACKYYKEKNKYDYELSIPRYEDLLKVEL